MKKGQFVMSRDANGLDFIPNDHAVGGVAPLFSVAISNKY